MNGEALRSTVSVRGRVRWGTGVKGGATRATVSVRGRVRWGTR